MLKSMARMLVPAALLVASAAFVPMTAQAVETPRTNGDCTNYADDQDINENAAEVACNAKTNDECLAAFSQGGVAPESAKAACDIRARATQ
ncbi:hypothetical protein A8924_0940 [Saccharopolyspora erythraea NRRL 2338]|nr:hypothetical protein [Saccharopolyspora erythraea]EQD83696.1 hypothetical protein N599_23890 [Saccharopolyspora erythraea D]PFG93689.1 hypothetical protein A8924_0940 [Saccharopolyspora erythraea NRRL 2338]